MIGALLVGLFALAALAYVSRPLIAGPTAIPDQERELVIQEVEARKRAALVAILDLEEERDIGKLSHEDFGALRTQYERQALEALREMDALAAESADSNDELEDEIARMRAEMTCSNCGALRTGSKCSRCGSQ